MADERARSVAKESSNKKSTLIRWTLGLPFRIAAVIAVSMVTSVAVEWLGMALGWWSQPGSLHAQTMFLHELHWIDTEFTRSLLFSDPVTVARTVIDRVYYAVFVWTGVAGWFQAHANDFGWAQTIAIYGQAAMDVSLVVLIRVFILALTLPLFAMVAFVAIVDGLVRRDLRRFGAGRESAFIYHRAKHLTGPVFITGWVIYLSVPFSIHPNVFLVPCVLLFATLITITVGTFKKYL